jgi:hypothetical protein
MVVLVRRNGSPRASRGDQLGEGSVDLISAPIHLCLRVWMLDAGRPLNGADLLCDPCSPVILNLGAGVGSKAPEQPMTRDDRYEPNRAFGMPRTQDPHARQGEELRRVMGIPVDWIGPVNHDLTWSLAHPIRGYRRWRLRRRLGPYAPDDDGPRKG